MRISPVRTAEAGNIFRVDDDGVVVTDLLVGDNVYIEGSMLFMSLGLTQSERPHPDDCYDFLLMNWDRTITVDEVDAALLELVSQEIG